MIHSTSLTVSPVQNIISTNVKMIALEKSNFVCKPRDFCKK